MDKTALQNAAVLARIAHTGQVYSDGEPYFTAHIIPVVERVMKDPDCGTLDAVVAYLHDTLEDTPVTTDDIYTLFGREVLEAVVAISRQDTETYQEYLDRVLTHPVAARVKRHDLQQNLYCKPARGLMKRYHKALKTLGVPA